MLWHIQDLRSADEKIWINFFIWYKLYSLDLRKLHLIYRVERIKELKKETMKQFWSNVLWYNLAVFLRMNPRIHMQITYISSYIYFLFHFCSRPPLNLISSFICEILPLHFHSSRHMDITHSIQIIFKSLLANWCLNWILSTAFILISEL